MGWVIDVPGGYEFEGYVQVLDGEGRVIADGMSDQAISERCDRDGAFWRAADSSGWVSPMTHRIPERVTEGKVDPPEWFAEQVLRPEWEQHVYATDPLVHVRMMTGLIAHHEQQLADLNADLARAVAAARRDLRASWAQIGDAAGVSKQAAWERWREHTGNE
jgi:hypothetical protein